MSWRYEQATGKLFSAVGTLIAKGWSGQLAGKNNTEMESVHNVGPIPRGRYGIGVPHHSSRTGPYSLPLTPYPGQEMFGRSEFLIHGAAKDHPELSSKGCIILGPGARLVIGEGGDDELLVV